MKNILSIWNRAVLLLYFGCLNISLQVAIGAPQSGRLVSWGQQMTPRPGTMVTNIAAGNEQTLAIQSDGTLLSWGGGVQGIVADTVTYSFPAPARTDLSNVVSIAVSRELFHRFAVALRADGTVFAWGDINGETNAPAGLFNVRSIAAGGHCLAANGDGTVVAWGGRTNVPAGLSNIVAVADGWDSSLALTGDGTVVAWGRGQYSETNVPSGLTDVTGIAAGSYHCLALKRDGTVVAWGKNTYGEATVPVGLSNVVAIAAGGRRSPLSL